MLRCLGVEVKNYDVTLRRLAYESLRPVQNPGNKPLQVVYKAVIQIRYCFKKLQGGDA